jgi:hypothetical protein
MEHQNGLTKQSLIAAATAAYVGPWLIFAIDLGWRIQAGADVRICPIGSQDLTDLCTIAEFLGAYLFVFLWALYGFPFALALTIIPALMLGRLARPLERKIGGMNLGLAQFALGTTAGAGVMLSLALVTDERSPATPAIVGMLAAAMGVWAFRRARYRR